MGALDYRVDLDDIKFCLFNQFNIDEDLGGIDKYADFDHDTYATMLEEAERHACEVLAPLNANGDRQGCRYDAATKSVITPDGYKEAWATMAEGGWFAMMAPEEVGGIGLPFIIDMACSEMFIGAAMSFWMYPGLSSAAARVLMKYGPEGMANEYAERMMNGEWGGTMCLTEAGAGSAVGDNRCKATPVEGEAKAFLLEGEKIFISGADQDLSANIIHLVLARTPGAPAGTRGLSLFLVPKFLVNEDGSNGERNGAFVVGIEEKMGLHGNATCTLALGTDGPCKGWLIGEQGRGMALMFTMMNEARIGVGEQGVALASTAYQYALAYAKERLQGPSLDNLRDPGAPSVAIIEHPDVRRMLMTMKVTTEALRSMMYRLAHHHDVAENTDDHELAEKYEGRIDLLVPVLKSTGTDLGYDVTVTGVQVLGGYGFTGEYPVEQLVRDGKIMSIYEGTNGIQAMDLVGRKLRVKGGVLLFEWLADARELCAQGTAAGFEKQSAAILKAVNGVGGAAMQLGAMSMTAGLKASMLYACSFERMLGITCLALETLDQALVAKRLIDAGEGTPHIRSKALNLSFFTTNLLPQAVGLGKSIQIGDLSCLDPELFS